MKYGNNFPKVPCWVQIRQECTHMSGVVSNFSGWSAWNQVPKMYYLLTDSFNMLASEWTSKFVVCNNNSMINDFFSTVLYSIKQAQLKNIIISLQLND